MKLKFSVMVMLLSLILFGCSASALEAPPTDLQTVRLGLGYIPNVQYAPFYLAQEKGYYAEEGLVVEIEYGFENDYVALAAQGEREFAMASGDQVILAQAQGAPVTYVMKLYQRYPVGLILPADQSITDLTELEGRKVGLPGLFGASFVGWKALAYSENIDESTVTVQEIGFNQVAALQQGTVDAAMGYVVNEPIQLQNEGIDVQVFPVADYIDLVSNGLVVGDTLLTENPELIQRMVRANLRGLQDTIDNPHEAFAIVREIIPEMTDEEAPAQRQVLEAVIELWRTDQPGYSSPEAWQASVEFMNEAEMLADEVDIDALYTNQFVE